MLIHAVLPHMRDRKQGCIINIASRSGTVDVPMTLGYVSSKAALIRATHTLQKEMELDGLDQAIQLYALHPGGVKGAMGGGKFLCTVFDPIEADATKLVHQRMSKQNMGISQMRNPSRTCSKMDLSCVGRRALGLQQGEEKNFVVSS